MTSPDLRSRLARLGYAGGVAAPATAPAPPRFPSISELIEGSRISTPHGECFVAEQHHPAGHPHGSWRLVQALEIDSTVLPWLGRSPDLAGLDLSRTVFL